jgi:subtilisin family serine protease
VLEDLRTDRRLALVQPMNTFALASRRPADPLAHLQVGFEAIAAAPVHAVTTGRGVRVAVVDSGVAAQHGDLADRVEAWRDMTGQLVPSADPGLIEPLPGGGPSFAFERVDDGEPITALGDPHGTAVAGVIAAERGNGIGVVGVAPETRLIGLRACWESGVGEAGRCSSFTLARALNVALALESDVITLGLAGPADPVLSRLLDEAVRRGVIVVAAAPRAADASFPTAHPGVIAVRAVEAGAAEAEGGDAVSAPGRGIFTTAPSNSYAVHDGASMAAAHVAGVVALLREVDPALGVDEVRGLLAPEAGAAAHAAGVDACSSVRRAMAGRGATELVCP